MILVLEDTSTRMMLNTLLNTVRDGHVPGIGITGLGRGVNMSVELYACMPPISLLDALYGFHFGMIIGSDCYEK